MHKAQSNYKQLFKKSSKLIQHTNVIILNILRHEYFFQNDKKRKKNSKDNKNKINEKFCH